MHDPHGSPPAPFELKGHSSTGMLPFQSSTDHNKHQNFSGKETASPQPELSSISFRTTTDVLLPRSPVLSAAGITPPALQTPPPPRCCPPRPAQPTVAQAPPPGQPKPGPLPRPPPTSHSPTSHGQRCRWRDQAGGLMRTREATHINI